MNYYNLIHIANMQQWLTIANAWLNKIIENCVAGFYWWNMDKIIRGNCNWKGPYRKMSHEVYFRCLNGSSIHISPQLVHQNSNVIALLEPKGCVPLDCVLLSSKLSYTCLQCNKEATAEVFLNIFTLIFKNILWNNC